VHRIDGFEDLHEIGRGGFGVVYRARETAFDRPVAIKVLTAAALTPDGERRFRSELRALGALTGHPNIVTVHSAGTTGDDHPYLVMSFLPGGSLADRLERSGPCPWKEVLSHGVRLAGALESAHVRGILHRDIKPENVLVSPLGEPCLADFGIAKIQGGTETRTGQVAASLAHAPPEILDGKRPAAFSDVYSLASTLFALLHGAPAFLDTEDHSTAPMLMRIFTQPVPDLRVEGVPAAFCEVLERAMEKAPEHRPPSARAFGEELQDVEVSLGLAPTPMRVGDTIVLPQAVLDVADFGDTGAGVDLADADAVDGRGPGDATTAGQPARAPEPERDEERTPPPAAPITPVAPPAPADPVAAPEVAAADTGATTVHSSLSSGPQEERSTEPGDGRRTPLLVAAGMLLVALVGGTILLVGGGDGQDDATLALTQADLSPTPTPTPEPTAEPTPTAEPAAAEDPAPAETATPDPRTTYPTDRDYALIEGITLDGDWYAVDFRTLRYDAELPGQHVHFFFDTVAPEQAGLPGDGPWFVYATPSPFREWGPGDRPPGAEELCVLVANEDHSVQPESGNCWPLP
jgi:serine/threonine-protein kinase PknK